MDCLGATHGAIATNREQHVHAESDKCIQHLRGRRGAP
jgi:hypothetical protein